MDSTTFSFPAIEWPSSNYNISFDARSNYFKSPSKTKNSFRKSSSNSLHSSYCALARKPLKQWSQWQLDFFYILELVTVSIEFCLIVTSIQEGVAFFHFFFLLTFLMKLPFENFQLSGTKVMSSPPEFNIRWQCSTLSQECQKIIFCSIHINIYSCFSQLC